MAEKLGLEYVPPHFLCVSHTNEKFDLVCLNVLCETEKQILLKSKLDTLNPSLKSFIRGKKAIAECDITVFCKLISHDASGKSSSLSDGYDQLIEKEGMIKNNIYVSREKVYETRNHSCKHQR